MKNGMVDYIAAVLIASGVPLEIKQSGSGCVVFSLDDRIVAI